MSTSWRNSNDLVDPSEAVEELDNSWHNEYNCRIRNYFAYITKQVVMKVDLQKSSVVKICPVNSWLIKPENTALVVVDMQRAFLDRGAIFECVGARELVPKINELAALCRKLKIPVIYLKSYCRANRSDAGLMNDFDAMEPDDEMEPLEGRKGAELYPGLNVIPQDYVVPKIRYSAFIPGSSSLEPLLRGLDRDSLIICGLTTDVCVLATTIDAMMLGFKVFLVSDLTATFSGEGQEVFLEVYKRHFAKVITSDEVIEELAQFEEKMKH